MGISKVVLSIEAKAGKFKKDLTDARNNTRSLGNESSKANKKMQNEFNKSGKVINNLQDKLVVLFSVAIAVNFIKKMVAVRSEFEKYEAVLKNTLGSQVAARKEMQMLQEFAAKTPFSLRELTGAYVKLVNYGLKPTREELRKLGDLAAALGKSFDMLTEAIADATTGEFERLKEFGIRATKAGDKVTFSFKEVRTEVDFTRDAITKYILSLGDLEGVAGGMAAISETLGGKISNLGDSWDAFLNTLGERTSGAMKTAIENLDKLLGRVTDLLVATDPMLLGMERGASIISMLIGAEDEDRVRIINDEIGRLTIELKKLEKQQESNRTAGSLIESLNLNEEEMKGAQKVIDDLDDEIIEITTLIEYLADAIGTEGGGDDDTVVGALAEMQKRLKGLKADMQNASKDAIPALRAEIALLEGQIKALVKGTEAEAGDGIWESMLGIDWKSIMSKANKAYKEGLDAQKSLDEAAAEKFKQLMDDKMAQTDADIAARLKKDADAEIQKQKIVQESFNIIAGFTYALGDLYESQKQRELSAAGDNAKKREEIERKYARKQQLISVAQALISGAEGILKTGANLGYPLAIPFQILQGIQTAIQVGIIKSQKFATGVLDLQGRGTGTSDSIPAMLSKGESVMTAKETQQYMPYLKAMKEGKFARFEMGLLDKLGAFGQTTNNSLNYDNEKEIKELREIRKVLKERPFQHEYYEGKSKIIKRGNVTTRINLN